MAHCGACSTYSATYSATHCYATAVPAYHAFSLLLQLQLIVPFSSLHFSLCPHWCQTYSDSQLLSCLMQKSLNLNHSKYLKFFPENFKMGCFLINIVNRSNSWKLLKRVLSKGNTCLLFIDVSHLAQASPPCLFCCTSLVLNTQLYV